MLSVSLNKNILLLWNCDVKKTKQYEKLFVCIFQWGCDLQKEHEKYLTQIVGGVPVFVTDFPASLKPFYAKMNTDEKTVS